MNRPAGSHDDGRPAHSPIARRARRRNHDVPWVPARPSDARASRGEQPLEPPLHPTPELGSLLIELL